MRNEVQDTIDKYKITDALQQNQNLDVTDVIILVENGEVTIKGKVHSPNDSEEIENIVRTCSGVWRIDNQLLWGC